MIEFKYSDITGDDGGTAHVSVETSASHLGAVVSLFKQFLLHVGYHQDNVNDILYVGEEKRQGLPQQMDLFPEELNR